MSRLSIAAAGDISFTGKNADAPTIDPFSNLMPVFEGNDLVIGNLEGPLTGVKEGVRGKCVLRGSTGWAGILKKVGFDFVSLANNHIMDYGEEGLFETLDSLKNSSILYAGAGRNVEEANRPVFIEAAGLNISVLARSAVDVNSRCYAGKDLPGVAFLDIDETVASIRRCKRVTDLVLVLLHWGIEDYFYPSPKQREQARNFIEAGADVILGHHPHVVQGVERIGKGVVAYSFGNLLFDDFNWHLQEEDGSDKIIPFRMNAENRNGMVLILNYNDGKLEEYSEIFTRIDGNGNTEINSNDERKRNLQRLSKNLEMPFYKYFWKLHSVEREWQIRLNKQLQVGKILKNLHKIRPHHVVKLLQNLKKSAMITFRSFYESL